MNISTIQKSGGISLIAGSSLLILWSVLWTTLLPVAKRAQDPAAMVLSPNWVWIASIALAAVLLTIFGFIAVYSRFYSSAGITGFLGFLFVITAYILQAGQITWEVFVYPAILSHGPSLPLFSESILRHHPMIGLFFIVFQAVLAAGVILFSIALLRSKEFHKSAGIMILAGALIYAFGPMVSIYAAVLGVLILASGCSVLGFRLTGSK